MLGHKASLNTFKKTKIVSSMGLTQQQEELCGALAPLGGGQAGSLNTVMRDRGSQWAWLRWLPTCLMVLCGVTAQYPLLCSIPPKWQLVCGLSISYCS